ncbi:MAG: alpha/beta fold hydrolase [Saprospiraceae bacterium]|nr:alpha/beta fold hydrolase [Saprospiraceae bacterium]
MNKSKTINFKSFGEGEPVIILHGLLGMLDNWQSFARKLSENYQVILLDQRNHGKSFHSDEFNYELLAFDLKAFMDSQAIDQASLIGHSMGGKTILAFLKHFRAQVSKPIIVDMSPKRHAGGHEEIFKALLNLPLHEINSRKEATAWLMNALNSETLVLFLLKNLGRDPQKGFFWKANIKSLWDNYNQILEAIIRETPYQESILFVKGGRSDYIDITAETLINTDYPNHIMKTIDDAGHWIHADKPEALLEIVKEYLRN